MYPNRHQPPTAQQLRDRTPDRTEHLDLGKWIDKQELLKPTTGPTPEIDLYIDELWWQRQGLMFTASGYGNRIPTGHVVLFNNRVHRVYCTIHSNIGTCWFTSKGQRFIVG